VNVSFFLSLHCRWDFFKKDNFVKKIDKISLDKNESHAFGIKSAILWGTSGTTTSPLLYLLKPKNISEEEYNEIVDRLIVHLKAKIPVKKQSIDPQLALEL
jgi:hypothetical protein